MDALILYCKVYRYVRNNCRIAWIGTHSIHVSGLQENLDFPAYGGPYLSHRVALNSRLQTPAHSAFTTISHPIRTTRVDLTVEVTRNSRIFIIKCFTPTLHHKTQEGEAANLLCPCVRDSAVLSTWLSVENEDTPSTLCRRPPSCEEVGVCSGLENPSTRQAELVSTARSSKPLWRVFALAES